MLNSMVEKGVLFSEKYLRGVERMNFYALVIFSASMFILEKNVLNKMFYVNIVLLVVLLSCDRKVLSQAIKSRVFQAVLVFFVYLLLRTLFSENFSFDAYFRDFKSCARIVVFLVSVGYFMSKKRERETMLIVLVLAAVVGGTIPLVGFLQNQQQFTLAYLGHNTNFKWHTFFGAAFSVIALLCNYGWDTLAKEDKIKRYGCCLIFVYAIILIYLSQSRAAMLGFVICFFLYLLLYKKNRILSVAISLGVAVSLAVIGNSLFFDAAKLLARKDAGRFELWGTALDRIQEMPIFGGGLFADLTVPLGSRILAKPHNLFLSVAIIGGLIGLLLFLIIFCQSIWATYRQRNEAFSRLVFTLLLFAMAFHMFASLTVVDKPTIDWVLLWMPVGMAMALEQMRSERGDSQGVSPL